MIIVENDVEDKKIEELEKKNNEELESLEHLIVLFEDIKNIESSNLDYAKEVLKDVHFNDKTIIGHLGNLCKAYFDSYYEIKIEQTQNLKKIITLMKLKTSSKTFNNDYTLSNNNRNVSNISEQNTEPNYIGKKDILEIIDTMSSINQLNNEFNNNYMKILGNEIDKLKTMEKLDDLDMLKKIKEEKLNFENSLEDICNKGNESNDLEKVKNILTNDNTDEQKYIIWTINYLNKYRSKLSFIEEKVYDAFKELFEIIFNKVIDKELYQTLDLAIILIQTFSTKKLNKNVLLEEEFKNNKIFQNKDIWINLILQKTQDLFDKVNEQSKINKENLDENDSVYIKENIEPILVSYIFTMKDFNIDNQKKKLIIEEICQMDSYSKFNFNIDELMSYSSD
jgi:hypothetical protein